MELSAQILSDIIVYMKYARYLPDKKRRETWNEIVDRNKQMHLDKFPEFKEEIEEAYELVYNKKILPSLRSLQFGGAPILRSPIRQYNCTALPMNYPEAFAELMFLLLSGCGVGISIQRHDIRMLPEINKPKKKRRFLIGDSIEGWSDAIKVLVKAYMGNRVSLPIFDFSDIRPKGTLLKTSGGKAPGPEPLKNCLFQMQLILDRKEDGEKLTPFEAYLLACHISNAVLAGGIRRSSMIALFSLEDKEMMECKHGNWYEIHPELARANNSVVILRHRIKKTQFKDLIDKISKSTSGEPGIFLTNSKSSITNPCAEISLSPFGVCNLTEINAATIEDQEDLNQRAIMAARIGTLQATYTNFHYLREEWQQTAEKEALLGVSLNGISSGKVLELDLTEAANKAKEENIRFSKLLKINPAMRVTTVKPSGTSSLVLGCSSGIHSWHSKYYWRRIRVIKNEPIYLYLKENHPELLEDDIFKPTTQAIIKVPIKAPDGAITREESALSLLERVSYVFENWILPGHIQGDNTNNISVTVSVKPTEWKMVGDWMWKNRNNYNAISVLPYDDHIYQQTPFEEITEKEYKEAFEKLKQIDLTKIKEENDETNLQGEQACAGGACEITHL